MRRWGCGALIVIATLISPTAGSAQSQLWPDMGRGIPPSKPIDNLKELHAAFFACWKAPPLHESRAGMEITISFSITRDGNVLGEPRFTFVSKAPPETRAIYQRSIAEAFRTCTPFPLTDSFGGAIAGRPQRLRFIDHRGQQRI